MSLQPRRVYQPFSSFVQSLAADRGGVIAVMMALTAVVLLGFVGLGVDVGAWENAKRDMQGAADDAAYSAGIAVYNSGALSPANDAGSWRENAAAVTASMGYMKGINGVTVQLNNPPPAPDPYHANPAAIQVVLSQPQPTWFSRFFVTSVAASASAVALPGIPGGEFCILVLKNVASAFSVGGNSTIDAPHCSIQDNSAQASAAKCYGHFTVITPTLSIVGGKGSCTAIDQGTIISPSQTVPDPLASMANPGYSGCDYNGYGIGPKDVVNLQPHGSPPTLVFCGGLSIKGTVSLRPGVYVIDGGSLDINAQAVMTSPAGDVHIFLTGGATITINGGATVTLQASANPSTNAAVVSSPLSQVLIYQDRADAVSDKLNGGSSMSLAGTLYFPSSDVTINGGNVNFGVCTEVIAGTLSLIGNATFATGCTNSTVTTAIEALPKLVE